MAKKVEETAAKGTVKVKLSRSHTHAGKDYKAGDEIEVREVQVKWLEEAGAVQK